MGPTEYVSALDKEYGRIVEAIQDLATSGYEQNLELVEVKLVRRGQHTVIGHDLTVATLAGPVKLTVWR